MFAAWANFSCGSKIVIFTFKNHSDMKYRVKLVPFFLFIAANLAFGCTPNVAHPPKKLSIAGVLIEFDVNDDTFPISWKTDEIAAKGIALDRSEKERSIAIIRKALAKYPGAVLEQNLKKIVVLKSVAFYGLEFGGTNSSDVVYVTNDGIANGYTDYYVEQVVHHEFSSILLRNYPKFFNDASWRKINAKPYGTGGVDALRNGVSSEAYDEKLMESGFLDEYSTSDLEEDFNTFAQNIFLTGEEFWLYCEKYPGIGKKLRLIISFYGKVDAAFTEEYFRKVSKE